MFEYFKEENFKLRQEVEELKRLRECEPSSASWSAVDVENEKDYSTPPPPPRRENEKLERKEEPRWTPNGTQVPSGPPPVHDELANYEVEEINRAMRWLGPEPSRVLQRRRRWDREETVVVGRRSSQASASYRRTSLTGLEGLAGPLLVNSGVSGLEGTWKRPRSAPEQGLYGTRP